MKQINLELFFPAPLCACGCGKTVTIHNQGRRWNTIVRGHTSSAKLRLSRNYLGCKHTEETKRKMSKIAIALNRTGKNNPNWRNQPNILTAGGYILCVIKNHPNSRKGYIEEHRLIMEKHLGRYLEKHECVHHINEIKTDNRIANLQLMTKSEHMRLHGLKRAILGTINTKGMTDYAKRRHEKCEEDKLLLRAGS